jgi:hypothetical protein
MRASCWPRRWSPGCSVRWLAMRLASTGGAGCWTTRDGWRKSPGSCWPKATGRSAVIPSWRPRRCRLSCRGSSGCDSGNSCWARWSLVSAGLGCTSGFSYVYGEEVARRIGNAGAKVLLSVIVIVAIGLGIRAGYSRWRATRQGDQQQDAPQRSCAPHGRPSVRRGCAIRAPMPGRWRGGWAGRGIRGARRSGGTSRGPWAGGDVPRQEGELVLDNAFEGLGDVDVEVAVG